MGGKLIVIEGTDCSGKLTQTKMLVDRLKKEGKKVIFFSFPNYETPTGKIIGGPYLGKVEISDSWFKEGAVNVDPKVASLYYAADRYYSLPRIKEALNNYDLVFLDRYIASNMGHQGGKIKDKEERLKMYKWIHDLEYGLLDLPFPDLTFFLHMPYLKAHELKKGRSNLDHHEVSLEHLKAAEKSYFELVELYKWQYISCVKDDNIKTEKEIHEEIYESLKKELDI
ncbi:MAG: dTMP kinase [Bacilli bacterium]|jgi:dTMP kinase